ncbi:hypothetical protein AA0473_1455 [Acetobacter orleanensis NRIC 0473]|uniref:Uncharacterized protein n=1 Tax=Acetobacter orleanensis TaxID=104099 RepID=A0A4Y3TJL9_9PROT|nr:hypothetical protein Abol_014_017 [Acetobacter orleanensis JCM 7639]GBR27497.1 hypothetical protein AA0473_1455 [Acetobacter orleanensis NRIC 0473]GEB82112.1 hypothetical protein AOR01nite_05890 [Acetobacter orleanensis]
MVLKDHGTDGREAAELRDIRRWYVSEKKGCKFWRTGVDPLHKRKKIPLSSRYFVTSSGFEVLGAFAE